MICLVCLVCYSQNTECNGGDRTIITYSSSAADSIAQAGDQCCTTGGASWFDAFDTSLTCNLCSQGSYMVNVYLSMHP